MLFDIGGVLEYAPDIGVTELWEGRLGLAAGELDSRMQDAWIRGSIGTMSLADVHLAIRGKLGLDDRQVADVLTFVRGSWSNRAPPVTADEVRKIRDAVRK